ncbi:efflux RND transporter periplasmic adaptor subunit [Otoolea muris]|uniref:efflux RND transporter periplasmic adaptor subunit n=1 Tax=Otoolea muris TaxID=2941515 RepID=UPI00203B7B3A|nr:efflux RND transporter periplasmic adaptor subunit [Otoolea muris]
MKNRESASCWDVVKRHKWLSIAGLLAVAAVAAAVAVKAAGGKGGQAGAAPPGSMGGGQMNHVSTVNAEKPQPGTIERTTSLSGTVEPSDVVYVYAKAGGDVTAVMVKAGDTVAAGQLLCTIDTDQVESARNSMDSAAVSLSEAQSTLSRMQLLYQGGDISDQEWEQYQNRVKTAKLQYDAAKLNYDRQVEYSSVTAPIGGRIETCDIEAFDRVNQNAQLCVISGEGEKRVSFYVTERVVAKLKQGDAITIRKNGVEYQGSISDVSTMVDETNGLFKVKAELPEAGSIATGSTVKVTVVSDCATQVMTIPVDAVYYDNGVGNVYLYEDGTVHKQQVEVGLYDSERAQILSGLTGEEMVISTWSSQLYEGSTVKLKGDADSENVPDGQGQAEKSAAPESGRKPDGGAPDGRHGGQGGAPGQNQ